MVQYLILIGVCIIVGRIVHAMMEQKVGKNVPWTLAHLSTMVIVGCIFCLIIIFLGGFR